ncbi:MAG: phosphoribosylamine--glycine ligase [Planctomycetota bacterium]
MSGKVNILLVGGGGREHAIARRLGASPQMGELHLTYPKNPGLASLGRAIDVPFDLREADRLTRYCENHEIELVVVGPEDPLAEGIADALASDRLAVFGPNKAGARLEADKAFCKDLLKSSSIPTADGRVFTNAESAIAYASSREEPPVIKAAGLAKGKGVILPASEAEAESAIRSIMLERVFGDAGVSVVIEERLEGPEVSVLAITDGSTVAMLPPCRDYKRIGEGGSGLNTGGMGAVCPAPGADDDLLERIERDVLVPTVDALKREGIDYRGVLYAGLMLTPAGPKVLEYNVRFGDPETQPLMARFEGDLVGVMLAAGRGKLGSYNGPWSWRDGAAACVVLASSGYPASSRSGDVITGIDTANEVEGVHVDHAGTALNEAGDVVTAGGRVLGVTAVGATLNEAQALAYGAADKIRFDGMQIRRDIGSDSQG